MSIENGVENGQNQTMEGSPLCMLSGVEHQPYSYLPTL